MTMNYEMQLRLRENDVLRLRARYASDALIRGVLAVELAIVRAIRHVLVAAYPGSSRSYRQR